MWRRNCCRFCCDDPPQSAIKSDSNEMLVLFRSFQESRICDDVKYPWKCRLIYIGFAAKYYTSELLRELSCIDGFLQRSSIFEGLAMEIPQSYIKMVHHNAMTWRRLANYWPYVRGNNHGSPMGSIHIGPVQTWCFFSLKIMLNKQSSCRWFGTPWRSCDVAVMKHVCRILAWWHW